jgi:hypothetical protein
VYITIPKSKEWLTINYVVNEVKLTLLGFYIFRGERICDDYIQLYKAWICMVSYVIKSMEDYLFFKNFFFQKVYTKVNIHNK